MKRRTLARSGLLAAALALFLAVGTGLALGNGVDPSSVNQTVASGGHIDVAKTVHTPAIPPNPDIMFLIDRTSSMGAAISSVQAAASSIMSQVITAQPTAHFGVATYTDQACSDVYVLNQPLTGNTVDVQNALNAVATTNEGCNTDAPEDFLNGLLHVATDGTIGFRALPNSSRVVVFLGDSSSHDPSAGHSLGDVTAALVAAQVKTIGVGVPGTSGFLFDGLDSAGQATAVALATGGSVHSAATVGDVGNEILSGLHNLPVTVTPSPSCASGLSASYDAASKSATSGDDVPFTETISVASNAPDGQTLHCDVDFLLNGAHQDGFQQTVDIFVPLRPADLSLVKTASPTHVTEGHNVTYTLAVTNHGTDPDTGVVANETLPSSETFVSGDPGCPSACSFGTVAAGATVTRSYVVTVNLGAPSSITNTATVSGDRPDPVPANNTSSATITVNHNPVCTGLTGGPQLWPPNHKLKTITVSGATDPDGNPLTYTVTHVTQDEALNGTGDGDTSPDAFPGSASNQVQLRSERSGEGDGRVYGIATTVSDGDGGQCTGTARVGVPHDQGGSSTAVDSGQLFTDF